MKYAVGRYLAFLTSDTIVTPQWLRTALATFAIRHDVGAVAWQLRDAAGLLIDAGGVSKDGAQSAYGSGNSPEESRFQYVRRVDHPSLDGLIIDRNALEGDATSTNGALRAGGLCILYQPLSIAAYIGKEAARDASPEDELAVRHPHGARVVLVMDTFVPFDDRDAGSRRILNIMALMRDLSYHVFFIPADGVAHEPYATRLRQRGIELVEHNGDAASCIWRLPIPIDIAWICRPELATLYAPIVRAATRARIVYDTVDLHHLRLQRASAYTNQDTGWESVREHELQLCASADAVVVTSPYERELLRESGVAASVVPVMEPIVRDPPGLNERTGLLYVGNYTHAPNEDAVQYLCRDIMPRVWRKAPQINLTLAGADPTAAVRALRSARVRVPGKLTDLTPAFAATRISVAPLRYGAGLKNKIVQSMASGVPVITTAIGAEGLSLVSGEDAIVVDDPQGFADAILTLSEDDILWKRLAAAGCKAAERFTPAAVKPDLERLLGMILERDA